jgi:hypothetical protein
MLCGCRLQDVNPAATLSCQSYCYIPGALILSAFPPIELEPVPFVASVFSVRRAAVSANQLGALWMRADELS